MRDDFVFLSWCCCVATSLLLLAVIWRRRFLLVKPSVLVIVSYHGFIQWAATLNAADVAAFLPDPWSFALLVHGFPLCGLLLTAWTGRRSARLIWRRLRYPTAWDPQAHRRATFILGVCATAVVGVYLSQVPLTRTGLYSVFFDPSYSTLAREQSLKLLDNVVLRYAYSLYISALAPMLVVLLAQTTAGCFRRKHLFGAILAALALAATVAGASFSGARSISAFLGTTVALAWLLRKGLPMNPGYAVMGLGLLTVPVGLTLLRAGIEFSLPTYLDLFGRFLVERVLDAPFETALWFAHYGQTKGFLGIAGIPKLAMLFGVEPINAPNLIGLAYTSYDLDSINANTGYVFAYYGYFGIVSLPFSLLALWLLDVILLVYRRIGDTLLLACVAGVSVACVNFALNEYTTVWVSGGVGMLLGFSCVLDRMCRSRFRIPA